MGKVELPGLCEKHGRLYHRRKVGGRDTYLRLPALDDPRFAEAYARASRPDTETKRPAAGTFAALIVAYKSSPALLRQADKTRADTFRYLDMIQADHGHRTVKGCRTADIRRMRDAYAALPGKANNWLKHMKVLMAFAVEYEWRQDNPARPVEPLEGGEHEPWPVEVLERALAAATPMLRLAIVTGLCSGARISDVIRMQHGWHDRQIMRFTTHKKVGKKHRGVDVAVPMHKLWLAEIDQLPRSAVTILYDRMGKPFSDTDILQERIRRLMGDIGSPTYVTNGRERGYSFHGLRKNAACYLHKLGLSDTEIGSICGMTPETVRHYTKRARSLMVARGAADRVTRGDVLSLTGGRIKGGAK